MFGRRSGADDRGESEGAGDAMSHGDTALATGWWRRIVNVGSLAGRVPSGGAATYCATKFGLRPFSLSLAEELDGSGIAVSVVSPGLVDTEFFAGQVEDVTPLAFSQPMSTAEQVARQILACACDGRRERAVPRLAGHICTLGYIFPRVRDLLRPWLERRGRSNREQYIKSKILDDVSAGASQGLRPREISPVPRRS